MYYARLAIVIAFAMLGVPLPSTTGKSPALPFTRICSEKMFVPKIAKASHHSTICGKSLYA